ncbi:hypothetical protein F5884DRAFT_745694 [Xylogone sp. PMI_703]|nr:hypothetical protein F5884DRAFT_745694 [Xylogone sp. PMI_703]
MFWNEDQIKSWKGQLYDEDGDPELETCANLICLQPTLHNAWGAGRFALYPIFWQRKHTGEVPVPPSTSPPETPEFVDGERVAYAFRDGNICSGDMIVVTTDDPCERPLPSFELLKMQWFLTRIVGMAGAADVHEEVDGDDDDDENPSLLDIAEMDSSLETAHWKWEDYSRDIDTTLDSVDSGLGKAFSKDEDLDV